MKIIEDFFEHNVKHLCRFCGTPIRNDKFLPMGNFAQSSLPLEGGGNFNFNGCKDCLRLVRPEHYKEICDKDPNMKKYPNHAPTGKLGKVQDIQTLSKEELVIGWKL